MSAPRLSLLERAVGFLSPEWALKRASFRAALGELDAGLRHFDAARRGRRTDGWFAPNVSANAAAGFTLPIIRARCRDLVRNNEYAAAMKQRLAAHMVGSGITWRAPRTAPEQAKQRAADLWDSFVDNSDPTGQTNFYGQQHMIAGALPESGECLVRWHIRPPSSGLRVPLQCEVLEADYLDASRNGRLGDNAITIQGVEYDIDTGRRLNYWLFPYHPGEMILPQISGFMSERVPADMVDHIYRVDRPGQVRGVPWLAPAALRLRDLGDYEEAEMTRKKIEACLAVFVKRAGTNIPLAGEKRTGQDSKGVQIERLSPGMLDAFARDVDNAADKSGRLERAWRAVKGAWSGFSQGVGSWFDPSIQQRIDEIERQQNTPGVFGTTRRLTPSQQSELDGLRRQLADEQAKAKKASTEQEARSRSLAADDLVRQITPELGQRESLENRKALLEKALGDPEVVKKLGRAAEDAQGALSRVTTQLANWRTPLQRVIDDGRLAVASIEATTFGQKAAVEMEKTTREIATLRKEQELRIAATRAGLTVDDEMAKSFKEIAARAGEAAQRSEDVAKAQGKLVEAYDGVRSSSKDVLGTFVNDLRKGQSASKALEDSMQKLADRLVSLGLDKLIEGLFGESGKVGGGAAGGFLGSIFSAIFHAEGGMMGYGGKIPLHAYAGGGVAYSPQVSIFGEGATPEAYVPLRGGAIPVTIGAKTPMAGQQRGDVHVNVIGAPAGTQVNETRDSKGGRRIDVVLDEAVARSLGSDRGRSAMASGYGVTPNLPRR